MVFSRTLQSVMLLFMVFPLRDSRASNTRLVSPNEKRAVELTYSVTINDVGHDAKSIYLWIPVPIQDRNQKLGGIKVLSDSPHEILLEQEHGNRYIKFDLSQESSRDRTVVVKYKVTRQSYHALAASKPQKGGAPVGSEALYLKASRLIPIDGKIAAEAERIAGNAETPLQQARLLYDHIIESMTYDKKGEGWGRGDAIYACDVRTGNCTDFHSLFIGEARSLNIPTRFAMGFPLPSDIKEGSVLGYHCWAEFYIEGRGWIPIDASEAHKFPEKKELFFGGLDAHRIQFTVGRDIRLPKSNSKPLNYSIYPHVEVNGLIHTSLDWKLEYKPI